MMAKPMSTKTDCHAELPCLLKIPRLSSQLHCALGSAQSRTVPHPIGRPAVAAADSCPRSCDRQSCGDCPAEQLVDFAATALTAVLTVLWVYSVRPIVSGLMFSSTTRIAPIMSVILATCRLYQPDTRSM